MVMQNCEYQYKKLIEDPMNHIRGKMIELSTEPGFLLCPISQISNTDDSRKSAWKKLNLSIITEIRKLQMKLPKMKSDERLKEYNRILDILKISTIMFEPMNASE
eukprot:UN29901